MTRSEATLGLRTTYVSVRVVWGWGMFAEGLFGVGVGMSLMTLAYNYPPALWGDGEVASPPRKRCGDARLLTDDC